jgi:ADP-ribosylglycohydrolase/protein-tyrosine phosphatase
MNHFWSEINSGVMPRTMRTLCALAMGDAYGVAFEFMTSDEIRRKFSSKPTISLGGGVFGFERGAFSDDTEMAALTLYSLHTRGYFDLDHIRHLYVAWAHAAKDVGLQTRRALMDNCIDYRGEGKGALMRILPAAVYMSEVWGWESEKIKSHCMAISTITHDNYRIHTANDFCIDLIFGNSMERYADFKAYFQQTNGVDGWVMNTLRIVYEALNTPTKEFTDGLWHIARQGGDTDTACAIYGAIRGYATSHLIEDEMFSRLLSDSSIAQLRGLFYISLYRYAPDPENPNLIAGQYPGAKESIAHAIKSVSLIDENIEVIINLMEFDELERFKSYYPALKFLNPDVTIYHYPILDMDIPSVLDLEEILLTIYINHKKKVYIHCWGGHGRTGTVVGAYLVNTGLSGKDALKQIRTQRLKTPFGDQPSTQTWDQIEMIMNY